MESSHDDGSPPMWKRVVDTSSIMNFRDMGNYPTIDGERIVAEGRLFRSASPGKASEEDAKLILEHKNICTWIDFRGPDERGNSELLKEYFDEKMITRSGEIKDISSAKRPSGRKRARYLVDLDYAGAVKRFFKRKATLLEKICMFFAVLLGYFWGRTPLFYVIRMFYGRLGLEGLYLTLLEECKPQLSACLKLIAAEENGSLINCAFGKDRTGTLAALVLLALDVPTERVCHDYSLTSQYLDYSYIMHHLGKVGLASDTMAGSDKGTMQATVAYLVIHHGGIEKYLDSIGFDADWRSRMRCNLTVDKEKMIFAK